MSPLRPWARGPFELLVHGDLHRKDGDDFDRRIAMISYDNAIETAITTFLSLNPIQRQDREYERTQVEKALKNYHSKVNFFITEVRRRGLSIVCEKAEIIWYHDVRNEQYHGGRPTVPQWEELEGVRKAAIWIFSTLFEVADTESRLQAAVEEEENQDAPKRSDEYDELIDEAYGSCQIAGSECSTSEALYGIDPVAYSEIGAQLKQEKADAHSPRKQAAA